MRRFVLSCTAMLAMAAAGVAHAQGLKRLDTGTDSRGWEAVGRLNLDGKGFCTGALIESNLVLTAAHCLWDKTTGERVDPAKIEFLAGWRNGRAAAYRGIRRAVPHPDYAFAQEEGAGRVQYDLALLELDTPIRLPAIRPYATGAAPARGEQVGVVSYAKDRAEAPSLQEVCHVLAHQPGVMVLSCDVDFGSSGAPVFSIVDGVPHVVSVVAAKAEMTGQKVALGSDMVGALATLRTALDGTATLQRAGQTLPQVGRARAPQPADRLPQVVSGQPARSSTGGAKFIRPSAGN